MFNEKQIIDLIKEDNSNYHEPITLPEPNKTEPFEKGVNPEK